MSIVKASSRCYFFSHKQLFSQVEIWKLLFSSEGFNDNDDDDDDDDYEHCSLDNFQPTDWLFRLVIGWEVTPSS